MLEAWKGRVVHEDQLASPDYFFLDGASFLDEAVDGII
jgi:hypothetical protein